MKRKFLTLALTLLTCVLLAVPSFAAEYGVIYTEAQCLQSDELTKLGKSYLPRFTAAYDTDMRVDVLTGIGDFSSLEEAAAAIYDEYNYGYGEGRNGVSLTLLVHEDEDGVAMDAWYLYAAGDNESLTTTGIDLAVDSLSQNMETSDWSGDAAQDALMLENAINTTTDTLIAFFLDYSAEAVPEESLPAADESIGYVTDAAGIMTAAERQQLETAAQSISDKHGFGVYIITVDSFRDVTDSQDVFDGATTLYNKYDLGVSEEKKGVLLLLSMNGRDFSLVTYSDYGNYVFDEATREGMTSWFLDNFADDDWFGGFSDYLAAADEILTDGPDKLKSEITGMTGIIFIAPLLVAAAATSVLGRKMKSVAKAVQAEAYAEGGLELTRSHDQFTHSTETRRKRKEESDNSGGGGRTRSKSSGGFGGTSGKF